MKGVTVWRTGCMDTPGDNTKPDDDGYRKFLIEANRLIFEASRATGKDATEMCRRLRDIATQAEARNEAERRPLVTEARKINSKYAAITRRVTAAIKALEEK